MSTNSAARRAAPEVQREGMTIERYAEVMAYRRHFHPSRREEVLLRLGVRKSAPKRPPASAPLRVVRPDPVRGDVAGRPRRAEVEIGGDDVVFAHDEVRAPHDDVVFAHDEVRGAHVKSEHHTTMSSSHTMKSEGHMTKSLSHTMKSERHTTMSSSHTMKSEGHT